MKRLLTVCVLALAVLLSAYSNLTFAQNEPMIPVCEESSATASYSSLFEGTAYLNAWNNANGMCTAQGKYGVNPVHSMDCGWLYCTATTTVTCRCNGQY